MRIISMTTIPSRILDTKPMIDDLLFNLNKVGFDYLIVNIPEVFEKTGEKYPKTPAWFFSDPRIVVNKCDDYGSATKFIPTLHWLRENGIHNGTLTLVDDDIFYSEYAFDNLFRRCKDDRIVGLSGMDLEGQKWWHIAPSNFAKKLDGENEIIAIPVHLLEGYGAPTYRIEHFDCWDEYWYAVRHIDEINIADDILLANYAAFIDVKMCIVKGGDEISVLPYFKRDALHNKGGNKRRYKRILKQMHERGLNNMGVGY